MIIWLASYPRSGNTLLRVILHEVFGQKTYSKYNDPLDIGADASMRAAVGHEMLSRPWPEARAALANAPGPSFVKTHEGPEDAGKAIYVVRNGFAATRSYQNYLRDFAGCECALEDVIIGRRGFVSWGLHLDLWQPLSRPDTLLVKFEDLAETPEPQIGRIAAFCGLEPRRQWTNDFEKLRALNPRFFRQGHTREAARGFSDQCGQLLWALHGDWMASLDYGGPKLAYPAGQAYLRRYLAQSMSSHQTLAEKREEEVAEAMRTFQAQQQTIQMLEAKTHAMNGHWWTRLGKRLRCLE